MGTLALLVVVVTISACGGDGGGQAAAPKTGASPPEEVYNTEVFDPAFSFTGRYNTPETVDGSPEAVDLSQEYEDFLSIILVMT